MNMNNDASSMLILQSFVQKAIKIQNHALLRQTKNN